MHLITLAHLGEAQSIIERFRLNRISPHFYQGENFHCLITGEGPFEAAIATTEALAKSNYQSVINLGIAGCLDKELEIGSIVTIRTVYLAIDGRPQFKSFATGNQGVDAVTSFERILSPEKALPLRGVGKVVDREAWGVAMATKAVGVSFSSFKLISDQAGTLEACEVIRDEAIEFSNMLAEFLPSVLATTTAQNETNIQPLGSEFYFTFTSLKKFESVIRKLSLREELPEQQILERLPVKSLIERKLLPKERARLLLEEMEKQLDPFKGELEQKLMAWKEPFHKKQIEMQTDPSWESDKIKIIMEVSSQAELEQKLKFLSSLDLSPFREMREGKF